MELILAENGVLKNVQENVEIASFTDQEQKEAFIKRDNKAKSLIVQCVEDSQLEYLREKKSAYVMWKTLEKRFEKKGLPGQLFLKKKLLSMKLKDGECLEEFIRQFEEIMRQLKATGAELKDEDCVCNLLLGLPKSNDVIVAVIENMTKPTYDQVKLKLLSEYEKLKLSGIQKNNESSHQMAFSTQGGCYSCGEIGHFKVNCPRKRNFNQNNRGHRGTMRGMMGNGSRWQGGERNENRFVQGRGRGRGYQSNTTRGRGESHSRYYRRGSNFAQNGEVLEQGPRTDNQEEEQSICFMGQVNNERIDKGSNDLTFIIDSGCTDHLVNNKAYFSHFVTLSEPIKIAIAKDDNHLLATGIGNIEVYSIVNESKIKCTLKNVFFIENLRKNLLSVKKK